jgi:hypothetical protein
MVALALTPNRTSGGQCSSHNIRMSEYHHSRIPATTLAGNYQRQENNRLVF